MADPAATLGELLRRAAASVPPSREDAEQAARLVRDDPVTDAFRAVGIELADRADERITLFGRAAFLCPARRLDVAGHEIEATTTPAELWRFYLPMCQALAGLAERAGRRVLAGIAGSGASGKSVFAALLCETLNVVFADTKARAAVCPMDGFHYPNAYLDSHFTTDEEGHRVPLRTLKGAPQTFDAEAFVRCVCKLREEPSVTVPRYDRALHDPVPAGIRVGPDHAVVLVEGNYLLLDEAPWAAIGDMLDLAAFVSLPFDVVRKAMVQRHVLGGRSEEDAVRHFERVDRRNYEICTATAGRADLVVRRSAEQRIVGIQAGRRRGPV